MPNNGSNRYATTQGKALGVSERLSLLHRKGDYKNNHMKKNEGHKLSSFEGVFLPTSLNVLSILMFLRFGFIIGQMGILGTLLLLVISYAINLLTVLSLSAICTNGTVKGGGAYYMISRSLGPEFGGAIGIIFFFGQILNCSLNVVGFIEPLLVNFGKEGGFIKQLLPLGFYWKLLYYTVFLFVCTSVALVGYRLVTRTALYLFLVLMVSTLSIPLSALLVKPFKPDPFGDIWYTGMSLQTIKENLLTHFTSGAVGSTLPPGVPESFTDIFGIFFPATAGILAGASMSGELINPSTSIPSGTLNGLLVSFVLYTLVIIGVGGSVPRELLYKDIGVLQTISIRPEIIILGELSTSLFSVIVGIVGAATLLGAIADDKIIPGLTLFRLLKKSRPAKKKSERWAILLTWLIAQVFLFSDINQIANFITMAFLMTFIVMNLACFLLSVSSAPNFRPSFKYFSSKTAFTGLVMSAVAMYIVDGITASMVIIALMLLIILIHYITPPLSFGDISQLLIYHQVRKYLLRLKLQMSVKYWRPQILLLCDDPRNSMNLIGFCNHLKKGGLYILGHVVILRGNKSTKEGESELDSKSYKEIQKQSHAWQKVCEISKIKAFVQVAVGPTLLWGIRNVHLCSGLGGMKPNITVVGFYNFSKRRRTNVSSPILPTDNCKKETKTSANQWVQMIEELMTMQITIAVASNFEKMTLPQVLLNMFGLYSPPRVEGFKKKYIDLYPIQISYFSKNEDGKSLLSTNFDTYTLILQLGSILSSVAHWKLNHYTLRIIVFVELQEEVEDERKRLNDLIHKLRIEAVTKVVCLDCASLSSYNFLVKGYNKNLTNNKEFKRLNNLLQKYQWWTNLCEARKTLQELEKQKISKERRKNIRNQNSYGGISNMLRLLKTIPRNLDRRRVDFSKLSKNGFSFSLNTRSPKNFSLFNEEQTTDSSGSDISDSGDEDINLFKNLSNIQAHKHPNGREDRQTSNYPYLNKLLKNSTDTISVTSSRNLLPNFLSEKIPKAQVNVDEDEQDEEVNPSIRFVDENAENSNLRPKSLNDVESIPVSDKYGQSNDRFVKPSENGEKEQSPAEKFSNSSRSPSVFGMSGEVLEKIKRPYLLDENFRSYKAGSILGTSSSLSDLNEKSKIGHRYPNYEENMLRNSYSIGEHALEEHKLTVKQLQEELKHLSFNNLPARGQHIILNELMRTNSNPEETGVIFSTLPPPPNGTYLQDNESFDYVENLAVWFQGLPPIMLLNSKTVTVTTAL